MLEIILYMYVYMYMYMYVYKHNIMSHCKMYIEYTCIYTCTCMIHVHMYMYISCKYTSALCLHGHSELHSQALDVCVQVRQVSAKLHLARRGPRALPVQTRQSNAAPGN